MSVLRFVPILGRRERRAVRAQAIEAAMEGAKERGFLTLPFVMTDAEIDAIRDRWKIATRLAHRQTAQIVLDTEMRRQQSHDVATPIPYEGPIYFPSLDARKESDGSDETPDS